MAKTKSTHERVGADRDQTVERMQKLLAPDCEAERADAFSSGMAAGIVVALVLTIAGCFLKNHLDEKAEKHNRSCVNLYAISHYLPTGLDFYIKEDSTGTYLTLKKLVNAQQNALREQAKALDCEDKSLIGYEP